MMQTLWDHLPNAKHIDRIIASLNHHGDIWDSAIWSSACVKWLNLIGYELRYQAWVEAKAKCMELDRWDIWHDSKIPRTGPVLALIAYDDCAHYLDMSSQELTTIALLGVTPAILLLPVVVHFEEKAKIPNKWLRLFRFIAQYLYSK